MNSAVKTVAAALKKTYSENAAKSGDKTTANAQPTNKKRINVATTTYNGDIKPINAKFIEREDISDEILREQAKEYSDSVYDNKISALNIDTDKKLNTLNRRSEQNALKKSNADYGADKSYGDAVEKISDGAVRQGLTNSSIYTGLLENAGAEYSRAKETAEREYTIAEDEIRAEIELVNASKNLALQDYELKKAAEYEKKLAELRRAELKARAEALEYNRRVAEFEAQYDKNKERTLEEWKKRR